MGGKRGKKSIYDKEGNYLPEVEEKLFEAILFLCNDDLFSEMLGIFINGYMDARHLKEQEKTMSTALQELLCPTDLFPNQSKIQSLLKTDGEAIAGYMRMTLKSSSLREKMEYHYLYPLGLSWIDSYEFLMKSIVPSLIFTKAAGLSFPSLETEEDDLASLMATAQMLECLSSECYHF